MLFDKWIPNILLLFLFTEKTIMLMKTIISKDVCNSNKFRSSTCKARSVIHQVLVVGRVLPNLKMGWHGADYTSFGATFHVWFCLLLTTAHGMDILQMKMQSLRAGSCSNSHTLLCCARSLISEPQSWNLLGVASTCRTLPWMISSNYYKVILKRVFVSHPTNHPQHYSEATK